MKDKDAKDERKGTIQYGLTLGLFVVALLMGLFFIIKIHDPKSWLFWAFVIWSLFFGLVIYCMTGEERYAKLEYYGTPVLYGLFFLLLVAFVVAGIVHYIGKFTTGDYVWGDMLAAPLALGSIGVFAYFTFRFFLRPYLKKRDRDDSDEEE